MASLERRGGHFRIIFRYGRHRFHHALDTQMRSQRPPARLEENLQLLNRGRFELYTDVDLPVFLLSDGRLNKKPVIKKSMTLHELFTAYKVHAQCGAKETNTVYIEMIHLAHLVRILGRRICLDNINTEVLQKYVDARSKEKTRRGTLISRETVKKEIGTFASVWNKWGRTLGIVAGPAPTRGLNFRKGIGETSLSGVGSDRTADSTRCFDRHRGRRSLGIALPQVVGD